jgi:hypothetical protein
LTGASQALVLCESVCHRRAVNVLRFLAPLAALMLLAGCQTSSTIFTKLRVTNYRDEVISEWVARGPIFPIERGYRITAVERISGPPYSMLNTYPDGWRTTVVGPHIRLWRCSEPAWLAEFEGDHRLIGIELDSGQSGK